MRAAALAGLAVLMACGSDPSDPQLPDCPDCRPETPILSLICDDGAPDEGLFAAHFADLEIIDAAGRPGYPDDELGARFSRKLSLALRGDVLAPVDAYVCVRSLSTHQTVFSQVHYMAPPEAAIPLGEFPRDRYVLLVRSGPKLLRSLRFASE
ncbi:MAG TPA: hypothetical protein VK939_16130 [Longimicrobiales bacterium]|nr:hypothetical protein [Longimicrobiales bacterium]